VDRVHDVGARVHETSLNMSRSSGDLRPGLNEPKGYSTLLILVIDAGMDDPRRLGWQGRCDRSGAPSSRWQLTGVGCYQCSGPLNTIRCSPTASGRRWRLAMAAHLAPVLGSSCDGSKGSLGSKIGERRW
jgi:hypothetical protein